MNEKLYNVKNLHKYSEKPFIRDRSKDVEKIYTFGDAVKVVSGLVLKLNKLSVPMNCGIALKVPEHSPASCLILLSILNHNCHFIPLDNDASAEMVSDDLRESGARFLISKFHEQALVGDQPCGFTVLDEMYYIGRVRIDQPNRTKKLPKKLCYTVSTSGSTGASKMVHVPYACIAPNVQALCDRLEVSSEDTIFLCAPLTFDPFVIEFFMALSSGAALVIVPSEIRLAPNDLVQKLFPGVTILQMTPSHFRMFGVNAIRERVFGKTSSLRALLLGGEAFPAPAEVSSWWPWKESPYRRIFNIYGITEVSCWSTIYECTRTNLNQDAEQVPLGAVIDSETQLRIEIGKDAVLDGVGEGELCVGSASRICHIPQVDEACPPQENAVLYRSTGDWVRRNAEGDIYYMGRVDNTIKRLGKRICLDALSRQIDILARSHLSLEALVVCCWLTQRRQLICCLAPPTESSTSIDQLQEASKMLGPILMPLLKSHERPDGYECICQLPLSAHGKLNRQVLVAKLEELRQTAALTPLHVFKRFLSTICNADTSSKLSFYAVGGTSFHALTLSIEIAELLSNKIDERLVLQMMLDESTTIAQICSFLEKAPRNLKRKRKVSNDNASLEKLKLLWRVDAEKCIDSSPSTFADTHICVGSHAKLLLCVDAATGCMISRLTLSDRIVCKVEFCQVVAAEKLTTLALVGSYDGILYAIDFLRGVVSWSVNVGGSIKAKPLLVGDGLVIVGTYSSEFNLVAVCLKSKEVRWRRRIGTKPIFASPIVYDSSKSRKSIVVCSLDGTCTQLDAWCGTEQWVRQWSTPIFSTPVLCDSSLLVVAEVQGHVHVCSTTNGNVLCSYFKTEGTIFSSIITTQTDDDEIVVYFGCHDQYIYCLKCIVSDDANEEEGRSATLNLLWKASLNGAIYATPLLLRSANRKDPHIIGCSTKGVIALLNAWTGRIVANYELPTAVYSTPCAALTDTRILVGCRDNYLYCFNVITEVD